MPQVTNRYDLREGQLGFQAQVVLGARGVPWTIRVTNPTNIRAQVSDSTISSLASTGEWTDLPLTGADIELPAGVRQIAFKVVDEDAGTFSGVCEVLSENHNASEGKRLYGVNQVSVPPVEGDPDPEGVYANWIAQSQATAGGPFFWYPMREPSGVYVDRQGNVGDLLPGNSAVVRRETGAMAGGSDPDTGSKAIRFQASSQQGITSPGWDSDMALPLQGDWTMEMFIRTNTNYPANSIHPILVINEVELQVTFGDYQDNVGNEQVINFYTDFNPSSAQGGVALQGSWYHVALVRVADTSIQTYVNGNAGPVQPESETLDFSPTLIMRLGEVLGAQTPPFSLADHLFHDWTFYTTALNGTQIDDLASAAGLGIT